MEQFELGVLGDIKVGKASLTNRFLIGRLIPKDRYDPTLEDWLRRVQKVVDDKPCIFEVDDIWLESFVYTALREHYIRTRQGFIIVYDITSRNSFDHTRRLHHLIMNIKGVRKFPIVLVGNKNDLVLEREVSTQEGCILANELGCGFAECSAMSGQGVDEAFISAARLVQKARIESQPPAEPEVEVIETPKVGWKERHRSIFGRVPCCF